MTRSHGDPCAEHWGCFQSGISALSEGTAEGTCDAPDVQRWLCQDTFQQQPGRNQIPVAGINEVMLTEAEQTFVKGV